MSRRDAQRRLAGHKRFVDDILTDFQQARWDQLEIRMLLLQPRLTRHVVAGTKNYAETMRFANEATEVSKALREANTKIEGISPEAALRTMESLLDDLEKRTEGW